jgi:hypothetical protein
MLQCSNYHPGARFVPVLYANWQRLVGAPYSTLERESQLSHDQDPVARNEDRHSHISIRLQCRVDDKWERLEALGWNEVGFNFFFPHELDGPVLRLKRGLTHFDGKIVWSSLNTSDEVVVEAIVNELIFKRAKNSSTDLRHRLLKLIRVSGMHTEKIKVLASLGVDVTSDMMATLLAKRKREQPLFHYGVQVQSDAWSAIVASALSISSVIISLEKWSGALGKS